MINLQAFKKFLLAGLFLFFLSLGAVPKVMAAESQCSSDKSYQIISKIHEYKSVLRFEKFLRRSNEEGEPDEKRASDKKGKCVYWFASDIDETVISNTNPKDPERPLYKIKDDTVNETLAKLLKNADKVFYFTNRPNDTFAQQNLKSAGVLIPEDKQSLYDIPDIQGQSCKVQPNWPEIGRGYIQGIYYTGFAYYNQKCLSCPNEHGEDFLECLGVPLQIATEYKKARKKKVVLAEKGDEMFIILEAALKVEKLPDALVFVDDSKPQVQAVGKAIERFNKKYMTRIKYFGYHYPSK